MLEPGDIDETSARRAGTTTGVAAPAPVDDDEVSMFEVLLVFAKYKKLLVLFPLAAAIIGVVVSLLLHDVFTATTKILPPQQSQSAASAVLSQLGNLGGIASGLGGLKNPSDLYVGMLKSRTVADNLIERFKLHDAFEQRFQSRTRTLLAGMTSVNAGKDGIITVEVEDEDPKRAADLANAYVDELRKLTSVIAVTEASQRRLFFEQQFAQAKDNLAKAEVKARQALQNGGLVKVDEQGRAMVETSARLRGQIAVKEVQIGAMRTFAADRNPELLMAQQELESIKRELAKVEGTTGARSPEAAGIGKGIDNLGLLRNLRYYETIYELLAKQYEIAKLDEAKDSTMIQVVDQAIVPDRKSKPKRAFIVLFFAFAGLLVAVAWAFVRETIAKASADPQRAGRVAALKRHLAWR
jgi:uncharacterized protein involved in exopolysaccharide biosynthesis